MNRAFACLVACLLTACGAEPLAEVVEAPKPSAKASAEVPPPPAPPLFAVNVATSAPSGAVGRWSLAWSVGDCAKVSAVRVVRSNGQKWREAPPTLSGSLEVDTAGLLGAGPYVMEGVAVEADCYDGRRARSLPVNVDAVRGQGWTYSASLPASARVRWLSEPQAGGAFWACADTSEGPRLLELSVASGAVEALSVTPWPAGGAWCPDTSTRAGPWLLAANPNNGASTTLYNLTTRKAVLTGFLSSAAALPGGEVLLVRDFASLARVDASGRIVWEVAAVGNYSVRAGVVVASEHGETVLRFLSSSYVNATDTSTVEVTSIRLADGARLLTRPLVSMRGLLAETGEREAGRLLTSAGAFVAAVTTDRAGHYLGSRLLGCALDSDAPCAALALPPGLHPSRGDLGLSWLRGALVVPLSDGRLAHYAGGQGAPLLTASPGHAGALAATASGSLVGLVPGYGLATFTSGEPTRPAAVYGVTPAASYAWTWQSRLPDGRLEGIAATVGADGRLWIASGAGLVALHADNLPE